MLRKLGPSSIQLSIRIQFPHPPSGTMSPMKPRARRIALLAVSAGCLVVTAAVAALGWGTVRDHAEAWWFQATRETKTFFPEAQRTAFDEYHHPVLFLRPRQGFTPRCSLQHRRSPKVRVCTV
jgi:hypothetical protein